MRTRELLRQTGRPVCKMLFSDAMRRRRDARQGGLLRGRAGRIGEFEPNPGTQVAVPRRSLEWSEVDCRTIRFTGISFLIPLSDGSSIIRISSYADSTP